MTLAEEIVAGLLGGAALLLVELRFEHRVVLGETWRAWIPVAMLALLLIGGAVALVRFRRGGRRVLRVLFGLALAVGALGVWFHADGHPARAFGAFAAALVTAPGHDGGVAVGSAPPLLAPLAVVGIGVVGLLACRRG